MHIWVAINIPKQPTLCVERTEWLYSFRICNYVISHSMCAKFFTKNKTKTKHSAKPFVFLKEGNSSMGTPIRQRSRGPKFSGESRAKLCFTCLSLKKKVFTSYTILSKHLQFLPWKASGYNGYWLKSMTGSNNQHLKVNRLTWRCGDLSVVKLLM